MTWLVVVLAFVLLGVGVVALAFSGGGRRAGTGRRRRPSRASGLLIGVSCVLAGLALPALMLIVNHDNQANAAGGVRLNAQDQAGRNLFVRNCSTCHTLRASNAVGKVGPNLDNLHPPAGLVEDAVINGRARGAGQMPRALLTGQDAKDVAAYVAHVSGR